MIAATGVEAAAGLSVYGAGEVPGAAEARARLVTDGVPALLAAKDPTLWGTDAEAEAARRLGWVDTFRRSRSLLPALAALRAELAGFDHVVVAGMGGSSLGAEVITRTLGIALTVLDTTDPHQVRAALSDRLERTVVVVSSKSGSTVETDAHRRAYQDAFAQAGLSRPGSRFVVVTDPGSPLEHTAHQMGAHVLLADPHVGGRYSALTAFGLVPAALASAKLDGLLELLDQAEELHRSLHATSDNPALALGAALAASARNGRDKLVLADDGSGLSGLGDWAEQLVAESTGKDGAGLLPVVLGSPSEPGLTGTDVLTVTIGGAVIHGATPVPGGLAVNGPLGAQFLAWEAATAIAGRLLGINPFDQPNVAESKQNTDRILASDQARPAPWFVDGAIEGYATGTPSAPSASGSLATALEWLLGQLGASGYLAVGAYLDRHHDAAAAHLRPALAERTTRPVTFGWGPRFLHSTGQYHKGGPPTGVFLQLTGALGADLAVPGLPYTFGQLQSAQAAGDRQALARRGRPLLWLHLTDRRAGIDQLLQAVR